MRFLSQCRRLSGAVVASVLCLTQPSIVVNILSKTDLSPTTGCGRNSLGRKARTRKRPSTAPNTHVRAQFVLLDGKNDAAARSCAESSGGARMLTNMLFGCRPVAAMRQIFQRQHQRHARVGSVQNAYHQRSKFREAVALSATHERVPIPLHKFSRPTVGLSPRTSRHECGLRTA